MGILDTIRPLARSVTRAAGSTRRRRGRVLVPGLRSDVEVLYSEGHVPHLYASSDDDLFFAQGWLTASERLWQLDLLRRAARGRLAEIFGERALAGGAQRATTIDADHLFRMAGLAAAAQASWGVLAVETRRVLERYAQGVNAWLEDGRPPVEFRLLRYRPEPWTPSDSLCIQKIFAFETGGSWRAALALEALRVGKADATAQRLAGLVAAIERHAAIGSAHAGASVWALGASRSASRAPLLCNDIQLPFTAPAPFFLAHLAADGYDVAGATLPGVPGVVVGHNRALAWGIAPAAAHDAELHVEELGDAGSYRAGDQWQQLEIEETEIVVLRRRRPVVRTIRRTRHGPLLTDLLAPAPDQRRAIALRWAGAAPCRDLDAILAFGRAPDAHAFRAALAFHGTPLQFCFADREGRIGRQVAGLLPRATSTPSLLDGARAEGWKELLPADELPGGSDAGDGLIVACAAPELAGHRESPRWRERRIRSMLGGARRHTAEEMIPVQLDLYSGWAAALADTLLDPLARSEAGAALTPRAKELLARILAWDHVARPESDGAACFYLFHHALVRELFGDGPALELLDPAALPLERRLEALPHDGKRAACSRALDHAAASIVRRLGADPAGWRWGALHRVRPSHRIAAAPLRALLSPGPLASGGDSTTTNGGQPDLRAPFDLRVGPVYRQILDLGDWDRSRVVLAGGQSGQPLSPRFRDQLALWAAGEYLPLPFSRHAVERASTRAGRLLLGAGHGPD